MTSVATNRIAADFYQGVDFPPGWAERPTGVISVGLAGKRVFSAIVLLDAQDQPLAACWHAAGADEQFVRTRFADRVEGDLLDGLNADMARKSERATGDSGLFATMLWEPKSLQPDQGIDVHPPRTGSFFDPLAEERGWNVDTSELVAKASRLLLVRRRNSTRLALPVPSNAAEMHSEPDAGDGATFVVLPAIQATHRT